MAYNFKSLADVELLKSTSDGVNLIAEDGGKIVKVAADSLTSESNGGVTSWNDLTDKPFDVIPAVDKLLIAETSYNFTAVYPNGGTSMPLLTDYEEGLIEGKPYVVVWDDVEYRDVVFNHAINMLQASTDDFVLKCDYDKYLMVFATSTGTHTIAFYEQGEETVKTLDPKFLPSSVQWYSVYGNGWQNVVPIYRGIHGTSEPDADIVPASEVLEAFKSGAEVRIYYAPSDCYGTMTGFNVNSDNNNAFIGMAVGSSEVLPARIGTVTSSDPT